MYFEGGYWDIRIDRSARFLLTPWGSRVVEPSGAAEDGPPMKNPPRRPPWSLVLPRHSPFLGRVEDDWQLDAGIPVTEDGTFWAVALTSLESPRFHGTLAVDPETCTIARVELGHMVQTLAVERTEPADADLTALADIKSTVREFTVQDFTV